jgi:DHA3 family macrolide efflux protein-like MFS transporter
MNLPGVKAFAWLWFGQAVSLVGSGLTGFALGVYVYQKTGSVTSFTLIEFTALAPMALLSPFAGALTDRWDKRRTLIVTDILSSLAPLALAWCLRSGETPLWQIGLASAVMSTLSAFQWPAFSSLTTMLVPSAQLGRAAGATELARGVAQIFSPVIAGIVMVSAPIGACLVIDSGTYLFSALLMFTIAGARYDGALPDRTPPASTLLQEIADGWRYLLKTRELLALTGFFAFLNVSLGIVEICITPMILSIASPAALGGVLWVGGIGMLLGGLLMSTWRGPQQPMRLVLIVTIAQGALLMVAGTIPALLIMTVLAFLYLFCFSISMATSHAMWLRVVPVAMQGSVLGLRRAIESAALPLAALIAGPLVELVFDPLAGDGHPIGVLGGAFGVGRGRGLALMYATLGAVTVLVSAVALIRTRPVAAMQTEALPEALT